jgi:site-specific DNA-methyltransferase (adenine-specific)
MLDGFDVGSGGMRHEIEDVLNGSLEGVIIQGDCLEVMAGMPDKCCVVVTDPPYGIEFQGKATKHTKASGGYTHGDSDVGPIAMVEALRLAVRAVVFSGIRLMFQYPEPYDIGCVFCPSGAGHGRWGFGVFNPILFYGKGLQHTRQSPSGFQSFEISAKSGHPCPKPIGWMEWAVRKCSTETDIILDPFCGSGTTCVAAKKLGRRYIGIEIDEKYCQIARNRVRDTERPLF